MRGLGQSAAVELATSAGFSLMVEFYGQDRSKKYIVGPSGQKVRSEMPVGKEAIARWSASVREIYAAELSEQRMRREQAAHEAASLEQQVGRPFEYEERLRAAVARQEEIDASLGLMESDSAVVGLEEASESA